MRSRDVVAVLAFALALAGCEGPAGPAGPAGPKGDAGAQGLPGPAGAAGVGTRLNYVVIVPASGSVTTMFTAAVGTDPSKPPAVACYLSNTGTGWLAVSDAYSNSSPYCFVGFSEGVWGVAMIRASAGWFAAFVVVY